jgi:segregation and condensation protein A
MVSHTIPDTTGPDTTGPDTTPETSSETSAPIAMFRGRPITELPHDLYIPPDALEVVLEAFEGPLDLLLYLIRRHNLDILDIPIAEVTEQYMAYIDLMQGLRLDLAAEYLAMAAVLAEIKSRMLLPQPTAGAEPETDPRAELILRLQEYERYKDAAAAIDALPRQEREVHPVVVAFPARQVRRPEPVVGLAALGRAYVEVLLAAERYAHHHITREPLSVRERMVLVLGRLAEARYAAFTELFTVEEGRRGVVVAFLAILELLRGSLIEVVQSDPQGPIYIKAAA